MKTTPKPVFNQPPKKSICVVMKVTHGLYTEHWDVFCVCADRDTAKIECDYRNARSRTNSYFVKSVQFISRSEKHDPKK